MPRHGARPGAGEIKIGRAGVEWVWAPWRTGGRLFGRRLQGGHPCLAGWRVQLAMRLSGERAGRLAERSGAKLRGEGDVIVAALPLE